MESPTTASGEERFWRGRAAAIARRVNSGWWIDRLNRLLSVSLMVLAVTVLLLRANREPLLKGEIAMTALGILVVVLGGIAWVWAKPRFISSSDGLVRLDDSMHLRNQLVTAAAGVGTWPKASPDRKNGASPEWRWPVVLLPTLLAGAILALACWVPFPERSVAEPLVTNEPGDWELMENWKDTLEEEDLIEPDSLREMEERLEELQDQPEDEWFSHASMEATDNLKETFGRDIQELANDMATLERDLEALRSFSTEMSEEGKEMLLREMEEAMKGLESNGLELNESLAKQLKGLDPSKMGQEMMKSLSSAEMKSLQEQLGKGAKALGSMEGLPARSEGEMSATGLGQMPGNGGINRGRADAPIFYGDEEDLKTNRIESVTNEDRSQAAIGDLLGVGETDHEEEELKAAVRAGGSVSSSGKGGEAVWRDTLLPKEKAVLKRYFK